MESTNNLVTTSIHNLVKDPGEKSFKEMSIQEKISYIRSVITIEPLLIFYFVPSYLCGAALDTLQIEKACRVNAKYNDTVCEAIISASFKNYTHENDNVQEILASVQAWQNPIQSIVPLILILFLASYSDRHKLRKPFLLLPIVGEFFAIGGCLLSVIFMRQLPVEVQGFSRTILPSFCGGFQTLSMAGLAYISDISTVEMRTLRIGIIQIVLTACAPLHALGGFLYSQVGYYGVFVIGGTFYFIAFVYGFFFIKETAKVKHKNSKDFFDDVFNPKHAIDTFELLFKPQNRTNVKQFYLVITVDFISWFVVVGEDNVFWLFAQQVYEYNPTKFSYFQSIKLTTVAIGSLIFVPLFTKVLKLHDAVIIIITFFSKIISNLLLIFLLSEVGLYAATIIASCASIGNTALKSLATKSVQVSDVAKALSLLSLCETMSIIASASIYNTLYRQTLATHSTAFLYVGVGLFSPSVILTLCLYLYYSKMFKFDINNEPKNGIVQEHYHQTTNL